MEHLYNIISTNISHLNPDVFNRSAYLIKYNSMFLFQLIYLFVFSYSKIICLQSCRHISYDLDINMIRSDIWNQNRGILVCLYRVPAYIKRFFGARLFINIGISNLIFKFKIHKIWDWLYQFYFNCLKLLIWFID